MAAVAAAAAPADGAAAPDKPAPTPGGRGGETIVLELECSVSKQWQRRFAAFRRASWAGAAGIE